MEKIHLKEILSILKENYMVIEKECHHYSNGNLYMVKIKKKVGIIEFELDERLINFLSKVTIYSDGEILLFFNEVGDE